jgi:hypothetical protein
MISLQVDSRHKEFFGVLCLHDYYADSVCKDLEFEPTPETAVLLRNYKLIFKPADFGFLILYSPNESEEKLRTLPAKTRFSFLIRSRNPKFMNFTKIKFWPEGVAFHYSNLYGSEEEFKFAAPRDVYYYFKGLKVGDVRKKLLHLPEHEFLPKRQPRFNVGLGSQGKDEKGVSYDSVVIKDEWGVSELIGTTAYKRRFRDAQRDLFRRHLDHRTKGLAKEELPPSVKEKRILEISDQLEKELSAMESVDQTIDLRHAPFGKYKIQMGQYEPMEVYTTEYSEIQAFGILDIHVDAPQDALLNRKADNLEQVINSQLFHIHFQSRATYWRYIFVNYENSKVTPKEIRDDSGHLSFTHPVESHLEQVGTEMRYCQSETAVPLKDRPEQVLFVSRMNGKRNMKEIRLPTPSGSAMVKPERAPGETEERIFSEVYVYL